MPRRNGIAKRERRQYQQRLRVGDHGNDEPHDPFGDTLEIGSVTAAEDAPGGVEASRPVQRCDEVGSTITAQSSAAGTIFQVSTSRR